MTRRHRARRRSAGVLAIIALFTVSACGPARGTADATRNTLVDTPSIGTLDAVIAPAELEHHLSFLASDELRGREIGTDGIARAEAYIASQFEALGLEPVPGEDDYFLEFDLFEAGYDRQGSFVRFGAEPEDAASSAHAGAAGGDPDAPLSGTVGRDFAPFWFSRDGTAEAEIVFAGYGITAPEYGYDDYAGLDVEGKIVFLLRHEPNENDPESPFDGAEHSEHAYFTSKAENASRRGAAGMVLVTDPLHHDEPDNLQFMRRLGLTPDLEPRRGPMPADVHDGFVAVHISQELGTALGDALGGDLADMQRALDAGRRPAELGLRSIPATVAVETLEEPRRIRARNVAAYLPAPGVEDDAEEDIILIGAHHDHLGGFDGAGDTVYNGADDNASGTVGVLELAERFALAPGERPAGMIFTTFSAEEWGLFGARAIIEEKLLPLERIARLVNLDMIGRNPGEPVRVYGGAEHAEAVRAVADDVGVEVEPRAHGSRSASDHTVFLREGVESLFFHTGLHEDYHEVTDELPLIDTEHMARVLHLVEGVIREPNWAADTH